MTKSLYFGVEVLYQHFDTAQLPGGTVTPAVAALEETGNPTVAGGALQNQNNFAITGRIHKDFLP